MLICDRKGRFLDENGERAKKIFSLYGDEYALKIRRMPEKTDKLLMHIHNSDIDCRISDELCEIVDSCLKLDPDDRPTTHQLCEMLYCLRNGIRIKKGKPPKIDEEKMRDFFRECVENKDRDIFTGIANKIYQSIEYQNDRR
jgi:hypothetical protein